MDATEALTALGRAALGATAAIALIAALRRPLRRRVGASAAYVLWALLPTMTLAAVFSRTAPGGDPTAPVLRFATSVEAVVSAPIGDGNGMLSALVLTFWGAGVLSMLAARVVQQYRWRHALGSLRVDASGIAWASPHRALPALVGWPRSCLVMPLDFAERFTPAERALVMAHERRHLARGDLHAQAGFELMRALLWFHPLLHAASAWLRHDQELACDADVLASRPQDAADYARALLRTTAFPLPPLATAWGSVHPLKERLAMLQHPPLSARFRTGALGLAAALIALCAGLTWAALPRAGDVAAPVPEGKLRQTWTFEIDGSEKLGPFLLVDAPGVPVQIRFDHRGQTWTLISSASALPDGRFDLRTRIMRGEDVEGEPRFIVDEKGGAIAIGREIRGQAGSDDFDVIDGFRAEVRVEAGESIGPAAGPPR